MQHEKSVSFLQLPISHNLSCKSIQSSGFEGLLTLGSTLWQWTLSLQYIRLGWPSKRLVLLLPLAVQDECKKGNAFLVALFQFTSSLQLPSHNLYSHYYFPISKWSAIFSANNSILTMAQFPIPPSLKESLDSTKVEYAKLGFSGLRVSRPILETMSFGYSPLATWVLDEEVSLEVLMAAYDCGINTWDTANTYSNGMSE